MLRLFRKKTANKDLKTPLITHEPMSNEILTGIVVEHKPQDLLDFFSTPVSNANSVPKVADTKQEDSIQLVYSVFNIESSNESSIANEEKKNRWFALKKIIADIFFPPEKTSVQRHFVPHLLNSTIALSANDLEVLDIIRNKVVEKIDAYMEVLENQTSCTSFFKRKFGPSLAEERASDLRIQLTFGEVSGHEIASNIIQFIRFGTTKKINTTEDFGRDTLRGQLIDMFIPQYASYSRSQEWLRNVTLKQRNYLDPYILGEEALSNGFDMQALLRASYKLASYGQENRNNRSLSLI